MAALVIPDGKNEYDEKVTAVSIGEDNVRARLYLI